jgi:hypothetical protein
MSIAVLAVPGIYGATLANQGTAPHLHGHVTAADSKHATTATSSNVSLNYDEQLGLTYTQNFVSIAFNVTAVEQTFNDSYGAGTGYLICGLSSTGYWYEAGLGWNWPLDNGGYHGGFSFLYEVFDSSGNSVFPAEAGLGLLNFSAPVQPNDDVNLGLSLSGGNVSMTGYDWNTSATTFQSYSAEGATYFAGLPSSVTNANGFFTGLLTEQYHASPYYGNMQRVNYTETGFAFSSAWMWAYESDSATSQVQFFDQTSSPVIYSNTTQVQLLSSNGASEFSDAYGFVTGSLTGTTMNSTTISATTATVTSTVTQASTRTQTTTTTITQPASTITQPASTITSTLTSSATLTAPATTLTSTSTVTAPPTTLTDTQMTTQTATSVMTQTSSAVPDWAYGAMAVLLLIGLAIGYAVKKPSTQQK